MKQLAIISIFLLLLTGCGKRVNQDTLVELSVKSMKEFSERLIGRSEQNLERSILNLCYSKGLTPREVQNEVGEKIYCYDAQLSDGTSYSILGYDRNCLGVVITINNSRNKQIPKKMIKRIRQDAIERGMFLSHMTGSNEVCGGYYTVKEYDSVVMIIICEEDNV